MRGGIAERGGVRVGHRIIEINGQSVVATPHEKIVNILSNAVGEVRLDTPRGGGIDIYQYCETKSISGVGKRLLAFDLISKGDHC